MAGIKKILIEFGQYFVIAITIFALGMYAGNKYFADPLKAQLADSQSETAIYKGQIESLQQLLSAEKNKPPAVVTETKTKTEIAYIPKETIIYRDSVSGETITAAENTDVELNVKPPTIGMKYNGKNYELPGIAGESAKFEKGKLVGEVSTMAALDVTGLVNQQVATQLAAQEKNISFGGYITNQGFVGSIGIIQDGGRQQFRLIGKLPKIKEFYGAGIEVGF